jgi:hypothetical protein
MSLGFTQALTDEYQEMFLLSRARPECKVDNLTAIYEPISYKNVGSSTSHNSMGLHGLLRR